MRRFSTLINKKQKPIKLPGILSDIDGVLKRGSDEIGGSGKVIKSLMTPFIVNN
jgi:ribonucleotide monophosphatase NagD (HAD superfamily)